MKTVKVLGRIFGLAWVLLVISCWTASRPYQPLSEAPNGEVIGTAEYIFKNNEPLPSWEAIHAKVLEDARKKFSGRIDVYDINTDHFLETSHQGNTTFYTSRKRAQGKIVLIYGDNVDTVPVSPSDLAYQIGDTGPAGGIVFYDAGSYENGWRYLEAAPEDIPGSWQWGAAGQTVRGISANGIGSGRINTKIIASFFDLAGEIMTAAQLADAYEYDGFNDWFLPSKDEIDLLYTNLRTKGLYGFKNGWYWTSSQHGSSSTVLKHFGNGAWEDGGSRNQSRYVRVIRRF